MKYLAKLITDSPLLSKRTEFETSAAYSARLSSFTQNPLAIGLLPTDVVAVVLKQTSDISVYEPLKVVYDADNQAFKLSLNFKKTTLYLLDGAPELASIIFENNIYDESKYPGRNAMGTTVEITEINSESYGIVLPLSSSLFPQGNSRYSLFNGATIILPVASSEAPTMKGLLRVAIVGNLKAPWIAKDVFSHDPTIDNPYKILEGRNYLMLNPIEAIVFRYDTGEILSRVKAF